MTRACCSTRSLKVTTALLPSLAESVPVIETGPADGVLSLLWLIIALPALGAAVLLLGGRRTDAWGHLLGVATVAGSFLLSALAFASLLGRGAEERSVAQHLY